MKGLSLSRGAAWLFLLAFCLLSLACGVGPAGSVPPVATVANTSNPIVARVDISSRCSGQGMVEFGPDTSYGRSTSWYPISGGLNKSSILVAGMKASSTYHMRPNVQCADNTLVTGPDITFKTGPLPSLTFPTPTITRPNPSLSALENPGAELINVTEYGVPAVFMDRGGNVIWYYDVGSNYLAFPFKPLPNGDIILNLSNPTDWVLREVDLAGHTVREMDISVLQQKMQRAGYDFVPSSIHHEILPLNNGHLLLMVNSYKTFSGLPGYPATTQVLGDQVIDLDQNWNPVWAWNSFDYLDVNRHLNGLPDWTHSNALVYSPSDGNILISMRHQSWILKLDYENGTGSGRVLWRLGYEGDFPLAQNGVAVNDPSLWFSFQHFPSLVSQNGQQTTLAIWDNGDNRVLNTSGQMCVDPSLGSPACYARPTVFQIDEESMVANLAWSMQLPFYSIWGGAINQLPNGNIEFDANAPQFPPSVGISSEIQEVTQNSNPQVIWKMDLTPPMYAYRAYHVPSLYPGVSWTN